MAPPNKYNWANIDWRLSNKEIAAILKCPYHTVATRRHKLKKGRAVKPATRKDKGISKTTYIPPAEQQRAAVDAAKSSKKAGRGVDNCHAKKWRLMSPDKKIYICKNLHHFCRQNPHLFASQDVVFKSNDKYCNASTGLQQAAKSGRGWKGWIAEQIKEVGK